MVNPPVISAPVHRGTAARTGTAGAVQSYIGYGIPSEGADQAYIGYGIPSEGADQAYIGYGIPSEGASL